MRTLGMFARHPMPGKTKTRLAASIGDDRAACLYAAFVEDLLLRCADLSDNFVVAATPQDEASEDWFRARMSADQELIFQPEGDLGDRIAWYFRHCLKTDGDHAVLIGSDSPDLPSSIIDDAFTGLNQADVVISPASDGGYVLIGFSRDPADVFRNVRWSANTTLDDTMAGCRSGQFTVKLLPSWYDVDTIDDLKHLAALQSGSSDVVDLKQTSRILCTISEIMP